MRYQLQKSVLIQKSISRDLLNRRNRLKQENTLNLKAVQAEKISVMASNILSRINYAAPRNENVGIKFRVNCSQASIFTIKFFYFQVHFPCK